MTAWPPVPWRHSAQKLRSALSISPVAHSRTISPDHAGQTAPTIKHVGLKQAVLWGKPPDRGDTTPRHEPGTGREQSCNTPLGGYRGTTPLGGCPGSPRATHETTPLEGREAWNTRSGPPGGVWHTQGRHTSSRIRALWGDREA